MRLPKFDFTILNYSHAAINTHLLLTCGLSRAACPAAPPPSAEERDELGGGFGWEEEARLDSPE